MTANEETSDKGQWPHFPCVHVALGHGGHPKNENASEQGAIGRGGADTTHVTLPCPLGRGDYELGSKTVFPLLNRIQPPNPERQGRLKQFYFEITTKTTKNDVREKNQTSRLRSCPRMLPSASQRFRRSYRSFSLSV